MSAKLEDSIYCAKVKKIKIHSRCKQIGWVHFEFFYLRAYEVCGI